MGDMGSATLRSAITCELQGAFARGWSRCTSAYDGRRPHAEDHEGRLEHGADVIELWRRVLATAIRMGRHAGNAICMHGKPADVELWTGCSQQRLLERCDDRLTNVNAVPNHA